MRCIEQHLANRNFEIDFVAPDSGNDSREKMIYDFSDGNGIVCIHWTLCSRHIEKK